MSWFMFRRMSWFKRLSLSHHWSITFIVCEGYLSLRLVSWNDWRGLHDHQSLPCWVNLSVAYQQSERMMRSSTSSRSFALYMMLMVSPILMVQCRASCYPCVFWTLCSFTGRAFFAFIACSRWLGFRMDGESPPHAPSHLWMWSTLNKQLTRELFPRSYYSFNVRLLGSS